VTEKARLKLFEANPIGPIASVSRSVATKNQEQVRTKCSSPCFILSMTQNNLSNYSQSTSDTISFALSPKIKSLGAEIPWDFIVSREID
jgi:hypothetical protein